MKYADAMKLEMTTDPEIYFINVSLAQLMEISVPTLLLKGDKSPEFLQKITDILVSNLPHNQVTTIPNAGHSMYKDNPEEFNQKVLSFLAKY
jgi:pimeloyl-ACP methyl ester carboxylesterase